MDRPSRTKIKSDKEKVVDKILRNCEDGLEVF